MSDSTDLLNALYASTTSSILTRIGEAEQYASNAEFFKTWEGKLFVSPRTQDGIAFVFGVEEEITTADSWALCKLRPTATLIKDRTVIHCWALEKPVTDEEAQPLADALGMESLDEMIPLPPTGEWALLQHDADRYYTLGDLKGKYCQKATNLKGLYSHSTVPTPVGQYHDAVCLTDYDPEDPRYKQPIIISIGANKESKNWRPDDKTPDVATLFMRLSEHREGNKDGLAFVTGEIVPGRRVKTAVKALYEVGLDIDNGMPSARLDEILIGLNCACIRYSTHSHLRDRTEFKKDDIVRFAPGEDVEDEAVLHRYLREKKHWDDYVVSTATFGGTEHTERGIMVTVRHAAMAKNRVIIPFKEPFIIANEGTTQKEAMERWSKVPLALAQKLGIVLDETGTDTSRLFYFPRHAKNRPYEVAICGGDLFDWRSLELDNPFEQLAKEVSKGTGKSKTPEGKELGRWSMKAAHGFQIVDVLEAECPDKIRGTASAGVDIECPFDEGHGNAGDTDDRACFCVNAGEGSTDWFTISCRHDTCREYTNLDMLGKMLKDGWFDKSVLSDENYNAAIIEDAPNPEAAERIEKEDQAKEKYQQAIDALTEDSTDDDIDEAIVICLEAKLNLRSLEAVQNKIAKATNTNVSTIRKMFKQAASDLRRSGDKKEDNHGLDLFSYNGEFHFDEAVKKCFRALKQVNEREHLPIFSHMSGEVVRLNRTDKNGRLSFDSLDATSLWSELNKRVAFVRKSDQAESTRGKVPEDVAKHCFEQGYEELPAAPEVIYTPLYTKDASLMVTPGWWPTHDILMANTGFRVGDIPAEPTPDQVEEAVTWLRTEVFGDFPFLDYDLTGIERREPSEANAFAMLLTPFMRRMITSCTPVFFVNKPTAGTGGTLLANIPIILFDGFSSAPMRYTQSEEEMQKAITAAIMETRSHLLFDDVREFNNRQLLQSITAKEIGGRVLGMSKNITRPNTFNWIATANNADVKGEMERRCCWIRLNAKTPDIQKRTFRHSNFDQFLLENRAVAVRYILTMVEYWLALGAPKFTERKRATFEDWSEKVGGVLQACGITGFLDNRRVLAQDLDEAAIKSFVRDWLRKYQVGRYVLPSELFGWANDAELDIVTGQNEDQAKSRFNRMLPTLDGRVFEMEGGEFMVRSGADNDENLAYAIVKVVTPPPVDVDPEPHVMESEAA